VPRSDLSLFIDFHRPIVLSESIADIPAVTAPGERDPNSGPAGAGDSRASAGSSLTP
jgi:hypothetical protein